MGLKCYMQCNVTNVRTGRCRPNQSKRDDDGKARRLDDLRRQRLYRATYSGRGNIRLSGEVVKRKKKLSKKYYGTSQVLPKEEAKFVFGKGRNQLVVDSGQIGNVRLSPEAEAYFEKKDCKVLLQATPADGCVEID
jgi:hypothetical protein